MAEINDLSPNTGRYLNEKNKAVNLADILGSKIRSGSLNGVFAVGTAPTPLRLGTTNLANRHTVHVINTEAETVYVGFTNAVTVANGIPIVSGEEKSFEFDSNENVDLYIVSGVATTVRLAEIH